VKNSTVIYWHMNLKSANSLDLIPVEATTSSCDDAVQQYDPVGTVAVLYNGVLGMALFQTSSDFSIESSNVHFGLQRLPTMEDGAEAIAFEYFESSHSSVDLMPGAQAEKYTFSDLQNGYNQQPFYVVAQAVVCGSYLSNSNSNPLSSSTKQEQRQ
jgi:hypothetical protein